jgi:hypothetical protein
LAYKTKTKQVIIRFIPKIKVPQNTDNKIWYLV